MAEKEIEKVDYSKMSLKEIYWNMKQDVQYLVADGKGYGDKGAVTEGQVQKLIKELEKKYKVLISITWKPHLYNDLNYGILTKSEKITTHMNGGVTVEKGEFAGTPYIESGDIIITLEKLDSDELMEWTFDYSSSSNNLMFMKAQRRTYHLRTNVLKWLGVATEEEDPEIKNLKDKEELEKQELELKERNMLKMEWLALFNKTDLTELEMKKLDVIRKYSRSRNEIELEKYINTADQSVLDVTIKRVKEVK